MNGVMRWLLGLGEREAPEGSAVRFELPGMPQGDLAWLAFAVVAAAVALIVLLYRRESDLSVLRRLILGALRVLALAVVVLMLLDPQLFTEIRVERRARTFLAFDTSASMGERDRFDGEERYDLEDATGLDLYRPEPRLRMARAAAERVDLIARLEEMNEVRILAFDGEVRVLSGLEDLEAPSPTGDVTRIGDALRGVLRAGGDDPIAAVVLVSDGRPTGGEKWENVAAEYAARAIPVHAVALGKARIQKNVAVQKLVAPDLAPLGFPFRIDARIGASGLVRKSIRATLTRRRLGVRGRLETVSVEQLRPVDGELEESLTFYDTLDERGTYVYVLEVKPDPDETSTTDNRRIVRVVAADQTSRVLLVAGSPTNEYRYLRNFLLRDEGVQASCWLASAPAGYPQDGDVVLDRQPKTERDLRAYDVVILLDPTAEVLDAGFVTNLRKLVVESGTGLAYVAGENQSAPGRIESLAPLLPVDLGATGGAWRTRSFYNEPWRPRLTPQGIGHPLCQLLPDPADNARLWTRLPAFYFVAGARKLRPAAIGLLEGPGGTIALAAQRAGAGYSVFVGSDDLWRWRSARREGLHERFWAGLVRFLSLGKKLAGQRDASIYVGRDRCDVGEEVAIEVSLLDSERRPIVRPDLEISVEVEASSGGASARPGDASRQGEAAEREPPKRLRLAAVEDRPGWYGGVLLASAAGRYTLGVEGAAASFEAVRLTAELEDPSPDIHTLRGIATRTGGALLSLVELDELPERIPSRTLVETVGRSRARLWDSPLVLALFCGAILLEWVLRKLWRLH